MKKLAVLWSNFRLKKISKKFKYGDFILIEEQSVGFHGPTNQVFKIDNVIWKGWFHPILLQVVYFSNGPDMFYRLKDLKKFTVFTNTSPKFKINQLINIDNKLFTVQQFLPHVMPYEFTDTKYLTFKYNCKRVDSDDYLNALEYDLSDMISSSNMWNALSGN